MLAGRRWSDGLHQAVEAKEGVAVRDEAQTLATITIQNYFRMYAKLAGMTGTAETEETEFFKIYKLEVVVIPTNRPVRRVDKHDLIYKTRREKYNAIIEEVERQHRRNLPVLVGTVSVDVSETLARMLKRRGLKHEVLNAKYHQREAEIVAMAGQPGAITIATNMAGRGTDIKLGPGVKRCQVCGIQARQAPFGQKVETPDLSLQEIKGLGCQDDPPCGLVIIGTERHESRRIDRQLRGRSGRQGDPGQSIFFLSLEDDLMRLFGSDRIARWMDRGDKDKEQAKADGEPEDETEVLTHPLLTRAIGQAQKRVELQNFQTRKKLLEYDDVMNQQRDVIYSRRRYALEGGEELKGEALRWVDAAMRRLAESTVVEFADEPEKWDRELIDTEFLEKYLITVPGVADPAAVGNLKALSDAASVAGEAAFHAKLDYLKEIEGKIGATRLGEQMLSHYMLATIDEKWKDHLYDLDQLRAAIQYRAWGQKDPLIEYKQEAFDMFKGLMEDLESTFAERWLRLQVEIRPGPGPGRPGPGGSTTGPLGGGPPRRPPPMVASKGGTDGLVAPETATGPRPPAPGGPQPAPVGSPYAGVGRNDPCPCGSGKKFKKCHGAGV
jgi:preprotein translocase subunit SecA